MLFQADSPYYLFNASSVFSTSLTTIVHAASSGGEIAGVVGALVSVPAVATLRILWRRLTNEDGPDAPVGASPDSK